MLQSQGFPCGESRDLVAVPEAAVERRLEARRERRDTPSIGALTAASRADPSPAADEGELPEEGLLEGEGIGAVAVLEGITAHETAGHWEVGDGDDLVAGGVEEGGEALERPAGRGAGSWEDEEGGGGGEGVGEDLPAVPGRPGAAREEEEAVSGRMRWW